MGLNPVRLGVDFDNTLISYDSLFYRAALERGLIPSTLPAKKESIRGHLRATDREELWTELQGTVYGSRIREASPFPGALEVLGELIGAGVPVAIVSHKTKEPIRGASADLHQAALCWLETRGVFDLGLSRGAVFFELTREAKLARIGELGLTHFLDDLKEVLLAPGFPPGAVPLLFSPAEAGSGKSPDGLLQLGSWRELKDHLPLTRERS